MRPSRRYRVRQLLAGGGQYVWRCKRCVGEAVTRRHQKVRRTLIAEAGGACALCGYNRCLVSLHFHHVDPAMKSFPMTAAVSKSLSSMRAEAKKCVLLCANCHGEVEAGVVLSPPAGSVYCPDHALPPSNRTTETHHRHHLDLDQHPRIDQGAGLDHRHERPDVAEDLSVGPPRLFAA